ncbi:MAG: S-methyl-5-thioribose-1-phosphate isomerase [Rhodospirillaceae bacterium]|nr:S-methyl-5-thioribose-1-phosphate isomerase [Rhodospirillaceae bacterium]
MQVNGTPYRSIWLEDDEKSVGIIDQTRLPHDFLKVYLKTAADAAVAIQTMQVRGAPLIGATAAWGIYLATREDPTDTGLRASCENLLSTRPTAVNLIWAIKRMKKRLLSLPLNKRKQEAKLLAQKICDEDIEICHAIGNWGVNIIRDIWETKGKSSTVNILTHCNAGWLATVDWGTATAPIYAANERGIPVHVWVDETRPRNQGAALTAWEFASHSVPHTLVVDNAGGHLMQRGKIDLLITGADRAAENGDIANKVGTYLKALAAADNHVPFYVGLPGPTIDWTCQSGNKIPIEERGADEVLRITGQTKRGLIETVNIAPKTTQAANPAFDVTPAKLITGLITERGICTASREGLKSLYPEKAKSPQT